MTAKKRKHTTITIPKKLYQKLEEIIEDTGFSSVSSYVTFIMRELVANKATKNKKGFTKEDEEKVKKVLKALGYME